MNDKRNNDVPLVRWESGLEVKPVYGAEDLDVSGGVVGIGDLG